MKKPFPFAALCFASTLSLPSFATLVLYDQDFENPTGFVNDGGDVNIFKTVNTLYSNQPAGFTFAQNFTVETLYLGGNQAFGKGYSDPSGIGGDYALGMLASRQNDLLGLSFDIGSFTYFNVGMDISSIDLSVFSGPFVTPGAIPIFQYTLFDNPSGVSGIGTGTILDQIQISGTASDRDLFDWTNVLLPLDATGNTNGKVRLVIDLLDGGYAAMDNFIIAASDTEGDLGGGSGNDDGDSDGVVQVSEPGVLSLLTLALGGLFVSQRRKRRSAQ